MDEVQVPSVSEPKPVKVKKPSPFIWGTGRRKSSVARVRIKGGTGKISINGRELEEFFKIDRDRSAVRSPLVTANISGTYDIWASVNGGGTTGQAEAIMLGLARALSTAVPECGVALRDKGLLTRDARMKERKKYGQKGARKRFQFSKR